MKYLFCILFFVSISIALNGQKEAVLEKGKASFVSSQNVYVKFISTKNINIGDTLYSKKEGLLTPALVVKNTSSTSTVCTPLITKKVVVSDEFFAKIILIKKEKKEITEIEETANPEKKEPLLLEEKPKEIGFKQKIRGRISAASYSNLSSYKNSHRMRYRFSLRGNNIKNSPFSIDSYITFRHTLGEWQKVKDNFSNALKIYSLSVKYDNNQGSSFTLGRKINPKISSMGAIDGLQYEQGLGKLTLGAIVGSRPDYTNYSVNLNLVQVGAYAVYDSGDSTKYQQTTLGIIEQRNKANIDRRFIYFQHSGELMKNLMFFSSGEFDLFENINNQTKNKVELTNIYVSLRYRLSRKLRLSASYDNRKNIIYYESYKNFIDKLIEDETRQGLRFGINYRPFRYVSWGVNSSLRFQKSKANVSRNLSSYINFSRLPFLNASATISANFLQTDYLKSRILGIRFSKELIPGKLNGEAYFRLVDYKYQLGENSIQQKIAGASLSLRIQKKLTWYMYYEGTFDNRSQTFTRFNTKLIQRF